MIMRTVGLRQGGDNDSQAPSIRGESELLVLTGLLTFFGLRLGGSDLTDRQDSRFFAEGFHDGVPHDQILWIDELTVGTKRIGTIQRPGDN